MLEIIGIMFNSLFFCNLYCATAGKEKSDIVCYITYKVDFIMIFSKKAINMKINCFYLLF